MKSATVSRKAQKHPNLRGGMSPDDSRVSRVTGMMNSGDWVSVHEELGTVEDTVEAVELFFQAYVNSTLHDGNNQSVAGQQFIKAFRYRRERLTSTQLMEIMVNALEGYDKIFARYSGRLVTDVFRHAMYENVFGDKQNDYLIPKHSILEDMYVMPADEKKRQVAAYTSFADRCPSDFMYLMSLMLGQLPKATDEQLRNAFTDFDSINEKSFIVDKCVRKNEEIDHDEFEDRCHKMVERGVVNLLQYDIEEDFPHVASRSAVWSDTFFAVVDEHGKILAAFHYECLKFWFMPTPSAFKIDGKLQRIVGIKHAANILRNASWDRLRQLPDHSDIVYAYADGGASRRKNKAKSGQHQKHAKTGEKHIGKDGIARVVYTKGDAKFVRKRSLTTGKFYFTGLRPSLAV